MTLATVLASLALLAAAVLWLRAAAQGARIDELEGDLRRATNSSSDQVRHELDTLRALLVRVAAGEPVDAEMIEEGRTWREVDAREAETIVQGEEVLTIDVRTPGEWASGVIPGAWRLSIDELEERYREIPNDGRTKLVVCAMGVRSAAACDFLASQGYRGLVNLGGGMSAWSGATERPS